MIYFKNPKVTVNGMTYDNFTLKCNRLGKYVHLDPLWSGLIFHGVVTNFTLPKIQTKFCAMWYQYKRTSM